MHSFQCCVLGSVLALAVGCADDVGRTEADLQTAPDPSAAYRVVVSFQSPGTGIDTTAFDEVLALVGAHDIDLSPDIFTWGLEGERNLCFQIAGLNTEAQALFVTDLQAISEAAQYVMVLEHARCDLQA